MKELQQFISHGVKTVIRSSFATKKNIQTKYPLSKRDIINLSLEEASRCAIFVLTKWNWNCTYLITL